MNVKEIFFTIDTHVEGEAFRIIIHSPIKLNQKGLMENSRLLVEEYKRGKYFLLNEPRGHRGMNGCIVTTSEVADFALLFLHHDGDVPFKYSGLIATVTALLETGNLEKKHMNQYKIETLNGIYQIEAIVANQSVISVSIESENCILLEQTPEYSVVAVDETRYYYVFPLPRDIQAIQLEQMTSLQTWGMAVTRQIRTKNVQMDGVILYEPLSGLSNKVRSLTFAKDGSIVRSPGFDSTFAIFTKLAVRKQMDSLTNESIFSSSLTAHKIVGTTNRFFVKSRGFITGTHEFIYDPRDPFEEGFLLK
ncbi:proline racemase family protein [Lederbergia sp. NSJ-179]|uniref:proline racemase family protein n=1 Tax=Lederbergia sp. NSJ-179 TaxID=2931402 RepID=UPI001FCFCA77|nr:proline racemase family protein [Lederbergia sp. NSJ-179]MCJ7842380.1 proline racemase family protein [Lederbergia sp. NSJ-179]